jgi:hypothetical protein
MTVAGNLISQWVWERYVAPKTKSKNKNPHGVARLGAIEIRLVEGIEERVVKTRRVRLSLTKHSR